jgi:PAS domain S-box-containing protein
MVAGPEQARVGAAMNIPQVDCRVIFDAVSDAILIHDAATGQILDVNRGMCKMFGYTPEEARKLRLTALGAIESGLPPEAAPGSLVAMAAAGRPQVFEWQVRDRTERVFWVEAQLKPIRVDGCDRILVVLRDIDQRKQAEEALKESEARYRMVTEGSLAGVYVIQDRRFAYVNPTMAQIFGYQVEEIMTGAVAPKDLIHPEDLALVQETIRRRLSGEMAAAHYTFRGLHRTGRVIYCESFGRAVEYQGRPAVVGTLVDFTERQRAEEALRRHAELLDLAHDAILVRDLDNRIVFWNSGAEETYGWSKEEVRGQEIHQLLHTEFSQSLAELEAEFFRQGQWQGELWHTRRDGRPIVVTSRWALQRGKQGEPVAILEINRDITERKQAEAGHARLAAILEATSDLVGTADRQGRLLYLNRAGRKMLGIGIEEDISHLTIKDLHPEAAYRLIQEQGESEARHHGVWSEETSFRSRDGQEIPTSQVIIFHKDTTRGVELFSTIARDITERKRAAEALQEANSRLQTLVQASPLAIIVRNLEGQITIWNPAAEQIFGWRQEEVMGRPLPIIPPDQEEAFKALEQLKLQGTTLLGLEQRRQRRDGSSVDISISSAPLLDGAGAMIGTMGIIEDITARKRMAETLEKVSRALKAITECHQALIRATNETELLNEVCRIIVEVGGYRMAWVGYAEDNAAKTIRPVAQRGFDDGYVEQLQITWGDTARGRGPMGKAIRLGKPAICRDTMKDRNFAPWRDEARKRDFHSVLGLPLKGFTFFGALGIYARERNAFDAEEVNLLLGLANDLAYGIMALRARAYRQRTEETLKKSEKELRLLTAQLLNIQEQERRRVARELHDELGQELTVLKIHLVDIEEKLSPDQQDLKANCEKMLSYIDTVIENVRRLSWDLSPSSLEDLGLSSALKYLVDDVCSNHHMQSAVMMDEIDQLFSPETQINIYRIFQESLTNVVRYARASRVSVKVKREKDKASFMIRDNGRGFDLKRAMSRKVAGRSLGLTAMNERARMAHGTLEISSQKGKGTTIMFTIPIDKRGK